MTTDLINEIAADIRGIDNGSRLSADGLATLVVRRLHDKGVIPLNQTRKIGGFIAANANMDPNPLAAAIVADFHIGHDHHRPASGGPHDSR